MIFVFGSNLQGIHGAGAALFAKENHGAITGRGEGLQGNSYAIPTCAAPGEPLTLDAIKVHVDRFLDFTKTPIGRELQYQVTRVGCGFAGYEDEDIAPMFINSPSNVWLSSDWTKTLVRLIALAKTEECLEIVAKTKAIVSADL